AVLVLLSLQGDTRQALIASPVWFVLLGVGYWVRRMAAKFSIVSDPSIDPSSPEFIIQAWRGSTVSRKKSAAAVAVEVAGQRPALPRVQGVALPAPHSPNIRGRGRIIRPPCPIDLSCLHWCCCPSCGPGWLPRARSIAACRATPSAW